MAETRRWCCLSCEIYLEDEAAVEEHKTIDGQHWIAVQTTSVGVLERKLPETEHENAPH